MITASFESGPRRIVGFCYFYGTCEHSSPGFSRAGASTAHVATVEVEDFGLTWSTCICHFPALPRRSYWVPQAGSWVLGVSAQGTSNGERRVTGDAKSLIFGWSEPLRAVLQLMLWRALPFCRQTLCPKATPWSSCRCVGWVSLLGFPEVGRVRSQVSPLSGQFSLFFIRNGICWQMLTIILGRQTLFYPYAKSS